MRGYAGKLLDVDLSSEKIKEIKIDDSILKRYIGGRGLAARILWDRLGDKWENVDPFSPENVLTVLTGPLTGYYPGGRICVSGKSPQSNGMVGSTASGEFGVDLKCAGYDGLIISGKASKPSYIAVIEDHVSIKDARQIWGKDGKHSLKMLVEEERAALQKEFPRHGELKEPSAIYIGPAGETKTRTAAVMSKWTHAAGYGGYGGVMGSKNLKAIMAKGLGPLPEVDNLEKVAGLMKLVDKDCYKSGSMRTWGTAGSGYGCGFRNSSEPVRNWQEEWHDEKSFSVNKFEEKLWVKKHWADFGCPTGCLKISNPKTGEFKGAITDNPDYEMQAYLGPNLGIFKPEDNVYLVSLMDDLGFCGIQTGNTLAFAAELYQRGILSQEELDGIKLEWKNPKAFAELARKIAKREGIGKVFAEGSYRAALALGKKKGIDLTAYVVHEKGMAIGAHGIRSGRDYPSNISYACNVQAGDHTSIASIPNGQEESELNDILHDSGVYCNFNTFPVKLDMIWDFYVAVTGWPALREEWYEASGSRILNMQRAMLLLGGPDLKWRPNIDDENPARFYEPLPSGPYKGKAVSRRSFEESKQEYYAAVGWDKTGTPMPETLKRLGLQDVEAKLKKAEIM